MDLTEKRIDGEEVFDGYIFNIHRDRVLLPNGNTAFREIVKHRGAVCVVPVSADGDVYLVRQFRYAVGKELLELPAGKLEENENPLEAAKRELSEETGFVAAKWTDLGKMYTSAGYSSEIIYVYLAEELERGAAHPDEDEFVLTENYKLDKLTDMIMQGEICDAKTVFGVLKTNKYING